MIVGVSPQLETELRAKYTQEQIDRFFSKYPHFGELRLRYARNAEATDVTSPMPSSCHMRYVAKGWTAVEVVEEAVSPTEPVIELPAEIKAYAELDLVGVWERGQDRIESSCRHGSGLVSKGWRFARLSDPDRARALAEARPWPPNSDDPKASTEPATAAPTGRRAAR